MRKKILFLCTGNSCRSQMAEGWCRFLHGDRYECYSAGIEKHGMNPRAVQVMAEAGVDLTGHHSKTTDDLATAHPDLRFDLVITVCDSAHESCPIFPGARTLHMGFQDPPRLTREMKDENEILGVYRRVRDEIREAVKNLPKALGEEFGDNS
jgi:arsenate reductase